MAEPLLEQEAFDALAAAASLLVPSLAEARLPLRPATSEALAQVLMAYLSIIM